jgi:putative component of membrane protein insertase Oxa1/YidC/SpoIIIJ protein YidD/surface antigen
MTVRPPPNAPFRSDVGRLKMFTTVSHLLPARRIRWAIVAILLICVLCKPLALVSISAYQRFISPHKGWRCAYAVLHGQPSCSAYGKEAISRHGVVWGSWLLWHRFQDCGAAADILAANTTGQQAGKECADGCVRGCCNGPPQVTPPPQPVRPRPPPRRPTAASVTVLSPSVWRVYDSTGANGNLKVVKITWQSTRVSGNVNIYVSRVSPYAWKKIRSNVPNTHRAEWTPNGPATPFARVRVQSVSQVSVAGTNDSDFCIVGPHYVGRYSKKETTLGGGWCTWYAAQQFEIVAPSPGYNWHGNAGEWYDAASNAGWQVTRDPERAVSGAIIVWSGGYGGLGDVGVFRRIDDSNLYYDAMNQGGKILDADNGITNKFGQPSTNIPLPLSNLDRKLSRSVTLTFAGFILPSRN